MTYPKIIGLNGYAQSGKDTIAGVLRDLFGYEQVAFADSLRTCLLALDPIVAGAVPGRDIRLSEMLDTYGYEETKRRSSEYRRLLQVLGTEVGRNILGADIWVDTAFKNAPSGKLLVFSDMRFPNEYSAIKARGGECWRVNRPGIGPVTGHISETALDEHGFDRIFVNNSSIAGLADRVLDVMDGHRVYPRPDAEAIFG